jgi:hypothetical protein
MLSSRVLFFSGFLELQPPPKDRGPKSTLLNASVKKKRGVIFLHAEYDCYG